MAALWPAPLNAHVAVCSACSRAPNEWGLGGRHLQTLEWALRWHPALPLQPCKHAAACRHPLAHTPACGIKLQAVTQPRYSHHQMHSAAARGPPCQPCDPPVRFRPLRQTCAVAAPYIAPGPGHCPTSMPALSSNQGPAQDEHAAAARSCLASPTYHQWPVVTNQQSAAQPTSLASIPRALGLGGAPTACCSGACRSGDCTMLRLAAHQ
jgi:hypothetical protein